MAERVQVLRLGVHAVTRAAACRSVLGWARDGGRRVVWAAPVHLCMEAYDDPALAAAGARADLVVPDGRPVFWAQQLFGRAQEQVRGTDLMLEVCEAAAAENVAIGLYGSTPEVLAELQRELPARFPGLRIAFAESPPFRPLSAEEEEGYVQRVNASGARLVFVGLGCPRQERFMDATRDRVHAVQFGVGAAFDFLSGRKPMAPRWMQVLGAEWLFRFVSEPRRLWRRYLVLNPRFAWNLLRQKFGFAG